MSIKAASWAAVRPGPMSEMGQQRTCRPRNPTSVLPPRPDIADQAGHVGFVPRHKVAAIGIGGSLAAPPLPHHRAYGSVHGGSRSCANTIGTRMAGRAI